MFPIPLIEVSLIAGTKEENPTLVATSSETTSMMIVIEACEIYLEHHCKFLCFQLENLANVSPVTLFNFQDAHFGERCSYMEIHFISFLM